MMERQGGDNLMSRQPAMTARPLGARLLRAWSEILDLLYPPRCEVCGADAREPFCADCRAQIEYITEPFCLRCNVPLAPWEADAVLCPECKRSRSPLLAVRSVGLHVGTLRSAVLAFKFGGAARLASTLAEMLLEVVFAEAERSGGIPVSRVDAIVPAVLHHARRRWRGFDQSVLLSRSLSRLWQVPMVKALVRRRHTVPQTALTPDERKRNLRGAFAVPGNVDVRGKVLVVVDDVMTTGATLEACARALTLAGAKEIYGLTVTRTAPSWHRAAQDTRAAAGL